MSGRARSAVIVGVRGHLVDIQAHVAPGLPHWSIVGLPDAAVHESRDRVRAAVASSGLGWPQGRITVGLGPASLPKRGTGLDLAIAVALLAAVAGPRARVAEDWVFIGELDLDGRVRAVGSVLAAAIAARRAGVTRVVVPAVQRAEAQLVPEVDVLPAASLRHVWAEVMGDTEVALEECEPVDARPALPELREPSPDLGDVRGQNDAREALVIAAAGGHHVCLAGPAGVGKTMLAQRLPSLLPDLGDDDALEATAVRALVLPNAEPRLVRRPPFCAPHHTSTDVAIIGGGGGLRPTIGLVTRAHTGVLFLDEAAEFAPSTLDALRQSLETRTVTVSRGGFHLTMPARFQLVLATNPCPCGRAFDTVGPPCECPSAQRRRYLAKLQGPLMDRVDVRILLARPTWAELQRDDSGEGSSAASQRVLHARDRAAHRLRGTPWTVTASVPADVVHREWPRSPQLDAGLGRLASGRESVRGIDLCLRLAWTLADLDGEPVPTAEHLERATALRSSESWST